MSLKPPLGIFPRKFFIEERIEKLSGALLRNSYQISELSNCKAMIIWAEELVDRLYELETLPKISPRNETKYKIYPERSE